MSALERALAITLAFWCALSLALHARGFTAHGVPAALADSYYALQGVFLPFVAALQLKLGLRVLDGVDGARDAVLAALALPPLLFLLPDAALLLAGRADLMPMAIRYAGPLCALLCAYFVCRAGGMRRGMLAFFALALPAVLLVR
ncbi:MAG: hypothetical protein AAF938_18320 [Myxococcota bacterium]